MKAEHLARLFLALLLAGVTAAGLLASGLVPGFPLSTASADYEIHARMPENGGWSQDTLYAQVGQPLHLRLTSDDVTHAFAVGQSDQAPVELIPGEWAQTTLQFRQPGRYTYYCTRWCGRNHWRMRGVIIVSAKNPAAAPQPNSAGPKPRYLRLGLELDAPHQAEDIPAVSPLAERGAAGAERLGQAFPAWALLRDSYLDNSPAQVYQRLRAEPGLQTLDETALWNLVAYLWARQTSPQQIAAGQQLYATNCAACHGENGAGDGVMVTGLPRYQPGAQQAQSTAGQAAMPAMPAHAEEMQLSAPPNFTDPRGLLGASPALLEGKLLRGGMGTGMPAWGAIFTQDQLDALVSYLYTFALGQPFPTQ